MRFLFDPARVQRLLQSLPTLATHLPSPFAEGSPSTAFPVLRRSKREIYRLLANPHYPHLRQTLRQIENVLATGVDLSELLGAGSYAQFSSHIIEAVAADHFILKGFTAAKVVGGSGTIPDLEIGGHGLEVSIEVYSPRSWEARADWETDVIDSVKNIDLPFDFTANVSVKAGPALDPWQIDDAIRSTGATVLERLEADFEAALTAGEALQSSYHHTPHDLTTAIELTPRGRSETAPARVVVRGGPGSGGYSPEGMFRRIMERSVRTKAAKRQASHGQGSLRGMIVDLSRSQIADDMRRSIYPPIFEQIVAEFDITAVGLDFLAICGPAPYLRGKQRRGLFTDFVRYEDSALNALQIDQLLRARV